MEENPKVNMVGNIDFNIVDRDDYFADADIINVDSESKTGSTKKFSSMVVSLHLLAYLIWYVIYLKSHNTLKSKVSCDSGVIVMIYKTRVVTWRLMGVLKWYRVSSRIVLVALEVNVQPKTLEFKEDCCKEWKYKAA